MRIDFLKKALERLGSETIERLRTTITSDRLRASGKLHDSMYYKIVDTNIELFLANYAGAVDVGITPNRKIPKSFVDNIQEWASIKGLNPKRGSMRTMAYAIAKSISERGIIKRFGYKGSNFIDRAVNNVLGEFDDTLLDAFSKDIEEAINKIK